MRTYRTTATLVSRLAMPTGRWEAADALAEHLGAEHLLVFTQDARVGALLPAPGFPQTFPRGRPWRAFLEGCLARGQHSAELPFPDRETTTMALGLVAEGDADAVLVLLGGCPIKAEVNVVRALLPLVAAAFRGERDALSAAAHAALADAAAKRANALAEALDTARRELQQAMWTRTDFLASASHDLKNPLAAIKGTAQLLRRRAERAGTPETVGLLKGLISIDSTASQMTALINDLLDLTRQQVDRPLELERIEVDLVALARRVVDEFAQTTERHDIMIRAEASELIGLWDAHRLERVLGNLVGNAIKYSPDGGVITVTIAGEPATDPVCGVLTIADQGLGIPAADVPRVFDRFHRASNVVGRIGGTGIGLASVRQTVETHGGTVSVESDVGRGSTFSLRLPLAPADATLAERSAG